MGKTDKIEKSLYTGYLWYSDENEPKILNNEEVKSSFDDDENPFIVEGWLTDRKTSYFVQFIDGKHEIFKYDLDKLAGLENEKKEFIPSFKGVDKLIFRQYWRPVQDNLCENMQVLVPAEFVFVGF